MSLSKYIQIFKISFSQEFAYRLNFIMWRVRNVLQILLLFFLWTTVFSDPERVVFGYNRERVLTYVFGILVVRAVVFSARAVDVAGEISRGDLTNLLLKPVGYFKYWLMRDLSSKALNLGFAVVEMTVLFLLLKPQIFFQSDPLVLLALFASLVFAVILFFEILMLVNSIAFWAPEMGWAGQFLIIVIISEFLSGALFPLDILPRGLANALYFTPFPYLIFMPIQIYLGKIPLTQILGGFSISLFWILVLRITMDFVWKKGLLVYKAEGR